LLAVTFGLCASSAPHRPYNRPGLGWPGVARPNTNVV
jgi:hypothetical protein